MILVVVDNRHAEEYPSMDPPFNILLEDRRGRLHVYDHLYDCAPMGSWDHTNLDDLVNVLIN